jgi:hypothetical protein
MKDETKGAAGASSTGHVNSSRLRGEIMLD